MGAIISGIVILVLLITITATGWTAASPDRGIVLGVSLPYSHLKEPEVLKMTGSYRIELLFLSGGFTVLAVPVLLIQKPFSLFFFLQIMWFVGYLLAFDRLLAHWEKALKQLKKQKGWMVSAPRIISIDTEVARLKGKMPVSKWWMVPSLVISCIPIGDILIRHTDSQYWFLALMPLTFQGAFWFCRWLSVRGRSTAYCDNSEINIACHALTIRLWTLCWAVLSAGAAICLSVSWFCSFGGPSEWFWAITMLTFLIAAILAGIFITWLAIRKKRNYLLEGIGGSILAEEDEFWSRGCYCNPYDPRTMVEKRLGIGWTINLGTVKGKILAWGTIGVVAVLLIGMFIMFVRMDVIPFTLSVSDDGVRISAAMYSTKFSPDEIEEISLIDSVPDGRRTNGAATESYQLGHYYIPDTGDSLLYVYSDSSPCLMIKLPDRTIFFTARDPADTLAAYEALSK